MTATTWQRRLELAHTRMDVSEAARDFFAQFTPFELQVLPDDCQPPTRFFEDDITLYAFELARHERNTPESAELVRTLSRFFSDASARLAQLTARNQHGDNLQQSA